ncbi:MAG: type II secretion system major pseudopilin GspG [Phycisphaerae bacterium]
MRRRYLRTRSGFTLIELLLVTGILALLAAFALPKFYNQAKEAKINLAKTAVGRNGSIGKALESYKWDMGAYPDTDEGLQALFEAKSRDADERYKGPYIGGTYEELTDPWGNPFEYRCPGDVNEEGYDLWSIGPDSNDDGGKAGSDDIKNWIEK